MCDSVLFKPLETDQLRLQGDQFFGKLVLYGFLIWPFIWDNANQMWHTAQLIHIPKPYLQVAEPLIIFAFSLYIILNSYKYRIDLKGDFVSYVYFIVLIGSISVLMNGSIPRGAFQVIWKTVRPFLVLSIVMNLNLGKEYIYSVWRIIFAGAILNAIVVIYQFLASNYYADLAEGLMVDAHVLSNYMFMVIFFIVCMLYIDFKKHRKLLLTLPFLMFSALVGSHEKAIIVGSGTLTVFSFTSLILKRGAVGKVLGVILSVLLLLGTYESVLNFYPKVIERFEILVRTPRQIGVIRGWWDLLTMFTQNPRYILWGLGPGRGGSLYAITHEVEGRSQWGDELYREWNIMSRSAWIYGIKMATVRTSVFLGILSEFGLLGLFVLFLAFKKLAIKISRICKTETDVSWIALGWILSFTFVVIMGFINISAGYNAQSNIFPLMVLGGLLWNRDQK